MVGSLERGVERKVNHAALMAYRDLFFRFFGVADEDKGRTTIPDAILEVGGYPCRIRLGTDKAWEIVVSWVEGGEGEGLVVKGAEDCCGEGDVIKRVKYRLGDTVEDSYAIAVGTRVPRGFWESLLNFPWFVAGLVSGEHPHKMEEIFRLDGEDSGRGSRLIKVLGYEFYDSYPQQLYGKAIEEWKRRGR